MSERSLSRRDFIKLVGIVAGSVALASCAPKLVDAIDLTPATDTHSANPPTTPPTETPVPPATPEVWKLSLSQQVELMRESDFFTELQGENTKKIITRQFDDKEYTRLNRKAFHNNSCGQATLATIEKMCGFLNTGKVPDITIADIDIALYEKKFTDIKGYTTTYMIWDDEMYFGGLSDALKILIHRVFPKLSF